MLSPAPVERGRVRPAGAALGNLRRRRGRARMRPPDTTTERPLPDGVRRPGRRPGRPARQGLRDPPGPARDYIALSLTSTPFGASVNWSPFAVPVTCITTPFWFCIAIAPAPAATVAPAPAATYSPEKSSTFLRL